jgi:hypothetical protein
MRHQPEIVRVLDPRRLIDSESYEHVYWQTRSGPLAAGYYVVHWPQHVLRARFDESAYFSGPFSTHSDARAALDHEPSARYRQTA